MNRQWISSSCSIIVGAWVASPKPVMLGLSTLMGRLDILPINYRIGLIRFRRSKRRDQGHQRRGCHTNAAQRIHVGKLHGRSRSVAMNTSLTQLLKVSRKVKFSPYASQIPADSHRRNQPQENIHLKRHSILCLSMGIRAYIIGHPGPTDFQKMLAEKTGGRFFTMPRHLNEAFPNQ